MQKSPFDYKVRDDFEKLKKENAPNYIPPAKRMVMREYLSNSHIKMTDITQGVDSLSTRY
jgi:hypothetical protein